MSLRKPRTQSILWAIFSAILFVTSSVQAQQASYGPYYEMCNDIANLEAKGETKVIDFGRIQDSTFLLTGWSHLEKTHTWAIGKYAEIIFYTFHPEKTKHVKILCSPFKWLKRQSVSVSVNDHFITSFDLEKGCKWYEFSIPPNFQEKFQNVIRFSFATWGSPSEYSQSLDKRSLAVAFFRLTINGESQQNAPVVKRVNNQLWLSPDALLRRSFLIRPNTRLYIQTSVEDEQNVHRLIVLLKDRQHFGTLIDFSPLPRSFERSVDLSRFGNQAVTITVVHKVDSTLSGKTAKDMEVNFQLQTPTNGGVKVQPFQPRHVLLIVVDTLRADRVGCYGGPCKTPNIDRLAANGIIFRRAYSHIPITLPSHDSIFTSNYPHNNMVLNNGDIVAHDNLTIAEMLSGLGYRTSAIVSLGTLNKNTRIDRGFQTYMDTSDTFAWFKTGDVINQEMIKFLPSLRQNDRWFHFLHYSDPHNPYHAHGLRHCYVDIYLNNQLIRTANISETSVYNLKLTLTSKDNSVKLHAEHDFYIRAMRLDHGVKWEVRSGIMKKVDRGWYCSKDLEISLKPISSGKISTIFSLFMEEALSVKQVRASYNKEVEYVDKKIGEILSLFKQNELLQDTVVILTGDHGEGLGDHDLIAHEHQLYDTLIHVPLIIWSPKLPHGEVIDTTVRLIDIVPTILEMMGVKSPSSKGQSLLPLIFHKENRDRPIFSTTFRPEARNNLACLIIDQFKIIKNLDDGNVELYNLIKDPNELNNLAKKRIFKLNRMERNLQRFMKSTGFKSEIIHNRKNQQLRLNPEDLEKLRGLGYAK